MELDFGDLDQGATHSEVVIDSHNFPYLALQMGWIAWVGVCFAYSAFAHLVVKDSHSCWEFDIVASVRRDMLVFVPANSVDRHNSDFVVGNSMNLVRGALDFQNCSLLSQVERVLYKPALYPASFPSILVFLLSNLVLLHPILVVATKEDLLQRLEHDLLVEFLESNISIMKI